MTRLRVRVVIRTTATTAATTATMPAPIQMAALGMERRGGTTDAWAVGAAGSSTVAGPGAGGSPPGTVADG